MTIPDDIRCHPSFLLVLFLLVLGIGGASRSHFCLLFHTPWFGRLVGRAVIQSGLFPACDPFPPPCILLRYTKKALV